MLKQKIDLEFRFDELKKTDLNRDIIDSNRHILQRRSTILEEMGFGTLRESSQKLVRKITRNSSIGLSDFWSVKEKEKFLKVNDLMDDYRKLQKNELLSQGANEKFKLLSLPRILNHNDATKLKELERNCEPNDYSKRIFNSKHCSLTGSPVKIETRANSKLSKIERVVNKCDSLAEELNRVRRIHSDFKELLKKKIDKSKAKKRISRDDLNKIKHTINKMN